MDKTAAETPPAEATTDTVMTAEQNFDSTSKVTDVSADLPVAEIRFESVLVCEGLGEEGIIRLVTGEQICEKSPAAPVATQTHFEISKKTGTGGCDIKDAASNDSTAINAAIYAVYEAIHKTARLARKTERALRAATAAPKKASDAHALPLVMADHIHINKPSSLIRAG